MKWFSIGALALLCSVSSASAQTKLVYAASELPPWKVYEGGQVIGVDPEIVKKIAAEMGITVEVVQAPLARCLAMLKAGEADLVTSIAPDPDREGYMAFVPTVYKGENRKVFYLNKSDNLAIAKLEDLHPLTVGVKRAASYFEPFDSDKSIKKEEVSDDETGLKMLVAKRFKAFIANEPTGDYLVKKLGLGKDVVKAKYMYVQPASGQMGLSKKSALSPRLAEFDRILKRMVESGEIAKIIKKYTE